MVKAKAVNRSRKTKAGRFCFAHQRDRAHSVPPSWRCTVMMEKRQSLSAHRQPAGNAKGEADTAGKRYFLTGRNREPAVLF